MVRQLLRRPPSDEPRARPDPHSKACCTLHRSFLSYEEFMFSPPETSQRLGGDVFGFSAAWDCPCSPCVLSFDRRVANVCVKLCVELPGRGAEAHAVQPKRTLAVSISRSLGQPAPFFLNSG